ncbi:cysteine protease [Candidatus Poribacteria bacterium]|nr:cysteine protease [Candidatus Poribacteria bacterium]
MSDDGKYTMGMGWLPDYPSFKDYPVTHDVVSPRLRMLGQKDSVKTMLNKVGVGDFKAKLATSVDLRQWCSPIENQLNLGSCTAHAGVGIVEYFENRAFGRYLDASRLFLYKVTRNLLGWTGDTGAFLRSTMEAMVLFGVPPEEYCKYIVADFEKEPSSFLYAFAQNFQAISYFRLDPPGNSRDDLLKRIKTLLARGIPSMFGFTVYNSISQASTTGNIPFPVPGERIAGGHAVAAVGYDDSVKIKNTGNGGVETKGALLIRNSWGTGWGDKGYGWLPYEYVLKGLAVDWWSLLKNEWVDTGVFKE